MALTILLALQAVLIVAGFAFFWRRIAALKDEVAELKRALETRAVGQRKARRAQGAAVATEVITAPEPPMARAARAWGLPAAGSPVGGLRGPTLSPETGRGLVLGLMAVSPAIAFFFSADPAAVVASGLAIAAAMMVIALRPIWRAAAWAGVLTAGAWALIGFALAAAHADPASYSICVALAGVTGLVHAHLRRATPGATMALSMSAALLALGSQTGMVGPAGMAFGALVAAGAIVGAMSLRLEAMHLASFGASVIGLFVLSGQDAAAIWFTPAAAWAGALYFAIALVRVPQLGPRGVALAGTGAFAPFGAIAALNAAQHGLADPYSAAAAFAVLALLIGGLIAISALRRNSGVAGLRLTLWVLSLGAFLAASAAIALAAPAQLAAPAYAALALGLAALDSKVRDLAWRIFAAAAGVLAVVFATLCAQSLLAEIAPWPAWAIIFSGLVAPAILCGLSAFLFQRDGSPHTAAFFETAAIALGVVGANLLARLFFSGGATLLQPIGFVETGVHATIWLAAALIIGSRAGRGASGVRNAAINLLGGMALGVMVLAGALWTGPFWTARPSEIPLLSRDMLGFFIPSVLFWAHWVFWRARGADVQTRLALGAGALLFAGAVTIEAMGADGVPGWARALIAAASFAAALGINFAPGVTEPLTLREKSPSRSAQPTAQ